MFLFSKPLANLATGVAFASVVISWSRQPALVTAALMAGVWVLASIHTAWPLALPGPRPAAEFSVAPIVRVSWLGPDLWACRRVFHPRSWADSRVTSDELRELSKASRVLFLVPTAGRAWAAVVRLVHALGALALAWTLACAGGGILKDAVEAALWPLAPGWNGDYLRLSGVYFGGFWLGCAVIAWPSKAVLGPDGVELVECLWRRRFDGRIHSMDFGETGCQLRVAGATVPLVKPPTLTTARWLGTWQAIANWNRDTAARSVDAADCRVGSAGIAR